MIINNVKGTHDIFLKEAELYSYVEDICKGACNLFNFKLMRLPVMEYSEVFVRGVGEGSDIVRKEMYTFNDKGGRSITLRPEFTAGIMRLIAQNKLLANNELPLKSYYLGPVFRYERPQLGRYREFNQFGVEAVGSNKIYTDIEVISLATTILHTLGLEEAKLIINTLGDDLSRENYKKALKEYFEKHQEKMCNDCKERLLLNPLRILDCKDLNDQEIIKNAPKISDYLSKESKERFEKTLKLLDEIELPYKVDETLVRGLDYYNETVFEFHYISKKGVNYGAIGAGGHYDKLLKEFNGPNLPGIGFSFGIERLVSVLKDDGLLEEEYANLLFAYIIPLDEESYSYAFNVLTSLRKEGYPSDIALEISKVGNCIKRALKKNAKYALIVGENEIKNQSVIVKDLSKETQEEVKINNLIDYFDKNCCSSHSQYCSHDENEK